MTFRLNRFLSGLRSIRWRLIQSSDIWSQMKKWEKLTHLITFCEDDRSPFLFQVMRVYSFKDWPIIGQSAHNDAQFPAIDKIYWMLHLGLEGLFSQDSYLLYSGLIYDPQCFLIWLRTCRDHRYFFSVCSAISPVHLQVLIYLFCTSCTTVLYHSRRQPISWNWKILPWSNSKPCAISFHFPNFIRQSLY